MVTITALESRKRSDTLKRIHVNQHNIKKNLKYGEGLPVMSVKTSKGNHVTNAVEILDDQGATLATMRYSPDKPLSCGATVWIETRCEVRIQEM